MPRRQADTTPDAIPKKRGPKTDVLESLLKRVDGLERRLQDENKPDPESKEAATIKNDDTNIETVPGGQSSMDNPALESTLFSPVESRQESPIPPYP